MGSNLPAPDTWRDQPKEHHAMDKGMIKEVHAQCRTSHIICIKDQIKTIQLINHHILKKITHDETPQTFYINFIILDFIHLFASLFNWAL